MYSKFWAQRYEYLGETVALLLYSTMNVPPEFTLRWRVFWNGLGCTTASRGRSKADRTEMLPSARWPNLGLERPS